MAWLDGKPSGYEAKDGALGCLEGCLGFGVFLFVLASALAAVVVRAVL